MRGHEWEGQTQGENLKLTLPLRVDSDEGLNLMTLDHDLS